MSQELHDQLDEDEKVALKVAILYPHRTLKEVLPELFGFVASDSTYYKKHDKGREKLKLKGILDEKGCPTDRAFDIIPVNMLRPMVKDLHKELTTLNKEKYKLIDEKDRELTELRMMMQNIQEMFDFTANLTPLPPALREGIDEAIKLFREKSYDSSIVKTYKISEMLVKDLFKDLYGDEELGKVRKHEDRLKKMWADEETEKKKYPGLRLIASLFSVILWYRNKMGAHAELEPTKEAARICLDSLLQALERISSERELETVDVPKFINSITSSTLNEKVREFDIFNETVKRQVVEALSDKIAFLDEKDVETYKEFLNYILKTERNITTQGELFEILLRRIPTFSPLEKEIILPIVAELTQLSSIKNQIKEKKLINLILAEYELSSSFNIAGSNTEVVLNLADILTEEELNRVIDAALSNGQIAYSWKARGLLKKLLSIYQNRIAEEKVKKLKEILEI
jgi:hypothetical protein